jgi:hypothetical protein
MSCEKCEANLEHVEDLMVVLRRIQKAILIDEPEVTTGSAFAALRSIKATMRDFTDGRKK